MPDISVLDAFNNSDSSGIIAENGFGSRGIWPKAGIHPAMVMDVRVGEGFHNNDKKKGDVPLKTPTRTIQFRYRLFPDHPENPNLECGGVEIHLPLNPAEVKSYDFRVDNDQRRLKGHLQVLLGDAFVDGPGWIPNNMRLLMQKLASSPIACRVNFEQKPKGEGKVGTYDNDFLLAAE